MNSGIYAIRNINNNKHYVGSTGNFIRRKGQHFSALNRKCHDNFLLQRAWDKHGSKSFVYEVIEECEKDKNLLLDREEHWIKEKQSHKDENGYNLCKIPRASRLGLKSSQTHIDNMRKSLSGKNHPMWGKHLKQETRDKISELQVGVPKPTSGKRKFVTLRDPTGNLIEINGIRKFCRDNNLSLSSIWSVSVGKQKEYKGWSI